jgi:hypothetical protein
MANELGAAPTGRTHINETEQSRAQCGVRDQPLHGPPLGESHGSATRLGQQLEKLATDRPNAGLKLIARTDRLFPREQHPLIRRVA